MIEKKANKIAKNELKDVKVIVCTKFPNNDKKIDTVKGSDQTNEPTEAKKVRIDSPNNNENFANNLNESNCEEIQTKVDLGVKKTLKLAEASQQISIKVKKFECNICSKKFHRFNDLIIHTL